MLKNRSAGEQMQGGEENKPRKKLSFRDPEVISAKNTPPHSAPAKSCSPPQFTRPHSVAGVMGLGGFSALGGVPGVSNPAPSSSHGSTKGITASPGISSNLPPRFFQQHHKTGNHSPTRSSPTSHSRHSSYDGMQVINEQESFLLQQKQPQQHPQRLSQKQMQQHPLSQSYPLNSPRQQSKQERSKQASQHEANQNIPEPLNHSNQSPYLGEEVNQTRYYDQSFQLGLKKQEKHEIPHHPSSQQQHSKKDDKKSQEEDFQQRGSLSQPAHNVEKSQVLTSPNKKPSSKVQRHHSLSPTRRVNPNRERFLSSSRNSDQALFTHSENFDSENQAMKVVRTVGQAFEVVHKLSLKDKSSSPEPPIDDDISREGSEDSSDKPKKDGLDSESGQEDLMTLTSDTFNEDSQQESHPNRPSKLEPLAPPIGSDIMSKNVGETFTSPLSEPLPPGDFLPQAGTPLSVHHELQLLREQLEQQQQQTQAAVAQVHLLRDQLAAETAARLEAQARTHQLLVHNKELLEHIQQLVLQVRELEIRFQGGTGGGNGLPTTIPMPPNPPDLKSEHQEPQIPHIIQQQRSHLQQQQQQQHNQYLTQQQQHQQTMRQRQYHISHETGIADQELKRDSIDSGRRLPQVPEDSISNVPLGATSLGGQRAPPNGPITRAASERYARQETLAQLQRMAWARHTTK